MHDNVLVPEGPRVILVGDNVHVNPEAGDTDDVKATVPVKPLTGATVMVDAPAAPALTVTDAGLAVRVKSGTATL